MPEEENVSYQKRKKREKIGENRDKIDGGIEHSKDYTMRSANITFTLHWSS